MSGTLNTAAVKEPSFARRVSARVLRALSATLLKAAHRLEAPERGDEGAARASPGQPVGVRFTADRVFWGFMWKDLYFSRRIIMAGFLTAAAGLGVQRAGAGFLASILLFCAVAAPAAFLSIFLIYAERQERSHLFDLSLPISPRGYLLGKVLAVTAAFGMIWLTLIVGIGLLIALSPGGTAYLPYLMVVWLFVLAEYSVLLWILVASRSVGAMILGTIFFNTSPGIFFYYIGRAVDPTQGGVPGWSPYALRVVASELAVAAVFFALTLWCVARQRDCL